MSLTLVVETGAGLTTSNSYATVAEANAYRDRIREAIPAGLDFEPLMTCYLTDGADPVELANGKQQGASAPPPAAAATIRRQAASQEPRLRATSHITRPRFRSGS